MSALSFFTLFYWAHFVNAENFVFQPFVSSADLSPCRVRVTILERAEHQPNHTSCRTCRNFTTSLVSFAMLNSLHPKQGKKKSKQGGKKSKQVKPWFTKVGLSRKEELDSKGEPTVQTQVSEAIFVKQTLEQLASSMHFAHLLLTSRQISRQHQRF